MQLSITPHKALDLLKKGNERFVSNIGLNRDLMRQVVETSTGQYPFATVLSCIDSRVPAEIIFDQAVGDIFSTRIAGNIVNSDILGSMEFACKVAGSKLIMVLGHTGCGAVKGACDNVELGNLTDLLDKIKPAISKESEHRENRVGDNREFVDAVAKLNVYHSMEEIKNKSPILAEMIANGEIDLAGGVYDINNGKVTFL